MNLEEQLQANMQEQIPEVKNTDVQLPDPDYEQPMMMTSRKANEKIANHLTFLKQLTKK